ncbi:MAG TPA: hypothetical protein VMP86_07725 [Candidatus Binatia bacterium]|nr:hypothetical protein [Candidatus Binatia bacterium]
MIDKRVREVGGLKQNAGKDEYALLREALRSIIRSIEQPPVGDDDFAAEDRQWRAEQETRYREEYGWESSNANDDAALRRDHLLLR